jgi:hypothetical protein
MQRKRAAPSGILVVPQSGAGPLRKVGERGSPRGHVSPGFKQLRMNPPEVELCWLPARTRPTPHSGAAGHATDAERRRPRFRGRLTAPPTSTLFGNSPLRPDSCRLQILACPRLDFSPLLRLAAFACHVRHRKVVPPGRMETRSRNLRYWILDSLSPVTQPDGSGPDHSGGSRSKSRPCIGFRNLG